MDSSREPSSRLFNRLEIEMRVACISCDECSIDIESFTPRCVYNEAVCFTRDRLA